MRQRALSVHGYPNGEIKPGTRLRKAGRHIIRHSFNNLKKIGETETGYRRVGAVSLHTDAVKLDKMKERAVKRRDDAPEIGDIRQLNSSETSELFPPLSHGICIR